MLTTSEECSVSNKEGRFIVFEGGHGSGKTTQSEILVDFLRAKLIKVRYTKEPYGLDFIPMIEKYANSRKIDSPVLLYLLAASRFCHIQDIQEWLKENEFVICDRYIISSLVYQQIQGFGLDLIEKVNYFAIKPDVTFFMKTSLEKRLSRLHDLERKRDNLFFKKANLTKEQELYEAIVKRWNKEKFGNLIVLDGEAEATALNAEIASYLHVT